MLCLTMPFTVAYMNNSEGLPARKVPTPEETVQAVRLSYTLHFSGV